MSCRSTFGGRAACMHATMMGVPSAEQSRHLHALIRQYRSEMSDGDMPAAVADVRDYFDRLELHARNAPGVSEARRNRLMDVLGRAREEIVTGENVPSRATLAAWQDLPSSAEVLPVRTAEPRAGASRSTPPYHKRFTSFHKTTVEATDRLFAARPSRLTQEERDVVFRAWVNEVSDAYGMERPTFRWDDSADGGGGGFYQPGDHSITMSPNHPSVTTLIHEFRHAMQAKRAGAPQVDPDVEIDARAWSLSLYHKVRPRLFERMVREGRLFHITPSDLDR